MFDTAIQGLIEGLTRTSAYSQQCVQFLQDFVCE